MLKMTHQTAALGAKSDLYDFLVCILLLADPQSELVRHFLIEPTSKGVRLKGCSNEPVFGKFM